MRNLDEVIRKLRELAREKPLGPEDQETAVELMRDLRKGGFTSEEISEVTGRAWSSSSVRGLVANVKVSDSGMKARAIDLIIKAVEKDISLDQVENAVSIKSRLDSKGTSLEEVADFLKVAEAAKASVGELVKTINSLILSKITVDQLKQILEYKKRYELMGLTLDHLKNMYTLLEKYGRYEFVIQAINTYNSLVELQQNLKECNSKKVKLETEISRLTKEISSLNEKRKEVEEPLKKYDNLKGKGLDEAALQELSKAREKFGSIGGVLRAVNSFGSLVEIRSRISESERNEKDLENRADKLRTENAQTFKAIEMCRKLELTYRFNLDTIENLIAIAEEYGSPQEVIEAIRSYGSLKAVIDKINVLKDLIGKYETNITQLKGDIYSWEKKRETNIAQLKADTYSWEKKRDAVINEQREYSNGLQAQKTRAERFGGELEEAKIILALRKYPSELKIENLEYLVQTIRSLASRAKDLGLNRKFVLKDAMDATFYSKHLYLTTSSEVELLEVLDWACRAITLCVVRASLGKAGAS
ncbi:MAG: hypothetical protein ABSB40_11210 [Nitrososphaeria archaeon]|jgi:chromosome segregation ATPase